jgi:hypothetical protein
LGDQTWYFYRHNIDMLFARFGFCVQHSDSRWFSRETFGMAGLAKVADLSEYTELNILPQIISSLDSLSDKLLKSTPAQQKVGVLGTTINAAFANTILKDRCSYFIEENSAKSGQQFHGKPVIHPQQLTADQVVLIPYGESALSLSERFANNYEGIFISID